MRSCLLSLKLAMMMINLAALGLITFQVLNTVSRSWCQNIEGILLSCLSAMNRLLLTCLNWFLMTTSLVYWLKIGTPKSEVCIWTQRRRELWNDDGKQSWSCLLHCCFDNLFTLLSLFDQLLSVGWLIWCTWEYACQKAPLKDPKVLLKQERGAHYTIKEQSSEVIYWCSGMRAMLSPLCWTLTLHCFWI